VTGLVSRQGKSIFIKYGIKIMKSAFLGIYLRIWV